MLHFSNLALVAVSFSLPVCTQAQFFERQPISPIELVAGDSRSVNWADIDADGDQDLLITNGPEVGESNFLFINNGGTFTQVTNGPIVNDNAPSDGATFADMDNDGDVDLFVANWWEFNDMLYTNDGTGTFTQLFADPAVLDTNGTETASWGDYDHDGFVDLYATMSAAPLSNKLYHNNGNGSFTAVLSGSQSTDAHVSRCVNWTDTDLDGDMDLFVTNEGNQNEDLYLNNGAGAFTALTGSPLVTASAHTMSSSWGDYDNDGDLDVFLANYNNTNKLFRNDGSNVFVEVLGQPMSSDANCSFSSNWADVDNDADLDLFVTNAYCPAPLFNYLYLNDGNGDFVKELADVVATDTVASYGQAFADVDTDGDLDLVVANIEYGGNMFYRNNGNGNHHVRINCIGTISNRSAIGTKVYVTATVGGISVTQLREITAQGGYCSQNEFTAHFGLGDAIEVDSVVIIWPAGSTESYGAQVIDQALTAVEGSGLFTSVTQPSFSGSSYTLTASANALGNVVEGILVAPFTGSTRLSFHDMSGRVLGNITASGSGAIKWRWEVPGGKLAPGAYIVRGMIQDCSVAKPFVVR